MKTDVGPFDENFVSHKSIEKHSKPKSFRLKEGDMSGTKKCFPKIHNVWICFVILSEARKCRSENAACCEIANYVFVYSVWIKKKTEEYALLIYNVSNVIVPQYATVHRNPPARLPRHRAKKRCTWTGTPLLFAARTHPERPLFGEPLLNKLYYEFVMVSVRLRCHKGAVCWFDIGLNNVSWRLIWELSEGPERIKFNGFQGFMFAIFH